MAKTTVEESHKLTIYFLKPYLHPGFRGSVRWTRAEEIIGSISYQVSGDDLPSAIRLIYTITKWDEQKVNIDYLVQLTSTHLAWGKIRYWFVCPLQGCDRRVGCLYLPPGGNYFGCRHCYNLAYESNQESSYSRAFDGILAASMYEDYPGITRKDVRAMLADKTTPHIRQLEIERYLREFQNYDPYEGYLSEDELCLQSGLTQDDLSKLEAARLLLPDTTDRRYRPKLAGWGKKLAYLLREGWGISDIQVWSRERWKSGNPRQWPPTKPEV